MACTELNFDLDEEPKQNPAAGDALAFGSSPAAPCCKPLDFSQITPSQLGISVHSFVPSSKSKDKSRLTQLKARRRSTIGARGSPETNALIRFIAQQRMKTPPSTPQMTPAHTPLQPSPFSSRGFSSLKQKMASFQSLLEVEEHQGPAEEEEEEADGFTFLGEKENRGPNRGPALVAPSPSKRRRKGPFRQIVMETREAMPPVDILSPLRTPGCVEQVEVGQVCSEEARYTELTSCELDQALCFSPSHSPGSESSRRNHDDISFTPTHSFAEARRQTWLEETQSPSMPLAFGLTGATSAESPPLPCPFPLATCPAEAADVGLCERNSERSKKKRVHFGVPLSPEFFDKRLPPSTPLQRGGTPGQPSTPGGSQLRSLLKTPQRSAPSLPQPDFNSPSLSGPPSPPPSPHRHDNEARNNCADEQGQTMDAGRTTDPAEEKEEETAAPGSRQDGVCRADVRPRTCEGATQRPPGSPDLTPAPPHPPLGETQTDPEPMTELDPCPSPAPESPVSAAPPSRPRGRKRKALAQQVDQADAAPAVRRPSRSAAVSASGKMKDSGGKRRFGGKAVDRSLYGKRDYASKHPALSPITESLSSCSRSPTPLRPGARSSTEEGEPSDGVVAAAALWRRRFCAPPGDPSSDGHRDDHLGEQAEDEDQPTDDASDCAADAADAAPSAADTGERRGGWRGRGRPRGARGGRGRGRKEPVLTSQNGESQSVVELELPVFPSPPGNHQSPPSNRPESDGAGGEGDRHGDAVGDALDEVSDITSCEPVEGASAGGQRSGAGRRRARGRRSSLYRPVPEEEEEEERGRAGEGGEASDRVTERASEGEEEREREMEPLRVPPSAEAPPTAAEAPPTAGEAPPTAGEAPPATGEAPPPWLEADFCIEDVLQAPARGGRRSVRRSLRNQSRPDPSASGLAWVPRPSPPEPRPARRRGRRSSAHIPPPVPDAPPTLPDAPPTLPEDLPILSDPSHSPPPLTEAPPPLSDAPPHLPEDPSH